MKILLPIIRWTLLATLDEKTMVKSIPLAFFCALILTSALCKRASSGEELPAAPGEDAGFVAGKACPAYQSKNKKTNPGNVQISSGKSYEFIQYNRQENPDWVQIRVPEAAPAERWVAVSCGAVKGHDSGDSDEDEEEGGEEDVSENEDKEDESPSQCRLAGRADDHTFALSWQPAFCELKSGKKECKIRDPKVYQANNFTLHGLWPNKDACQTSYGFCKGEKKSGDFCEYNPVPISAQLKSSLSRVMPSVSAGTCLERYEWYKHGLCQTQWTAEEYFAISVRFTEEFNKAAAPVINESVGESVQEEDFFAAIDEAFGPNAHKRLQLKCQKGDLVDVYIKLPRDITITSSLKELIQKARPAFRSNCGGSFQVDEIDD